MTQTPPRPRFRYTVANRGSRLYYQVPRAIHDVNALDVFLTDFYTPEFIYRARRLLPQTLRDLVTRRYEPHLRGVPIRSAMATSELKRLLNRRGGEAPKPYVGPTAIRLGQLAAESSNRRHTASLVNGYSAPGFVAMKSLWKDRPGIIHQEHPPPSQILGIVQSARREGWYDGREPEDDLTAAEIARCEQSLREADGVIVSSAFVRRGLLDIGVSASRIGVVPLGGDRLCVASAHDPGRDSTTERAGPLRILWVGQPTPRKGFRQVVEAVAKMPAGAAILVLVFPSARTAVNLPDALSAVHVHRQISDVRLADIYRDCDLLVMPSLYEGFGMVYAEALHAGLPVVTTRNTGVADLVTQGIDGWVIHPGDPSELIEVLLACARHPDKVREMRPAAAALGASLTWAHFRSELVATICEFERTWQSGTG